MSSEDFSPLPRLSEECPAADDSAPQPPLICLSRGWGRRRSRLFPQGFRNQTSLRAGVRLPRRCQSAASECGHNDPDLLSCSHRGVIHQSPAERRGSVNWLMPDYLWTSARAAWWTVSSVGGCAFVKLTPSPSSPLIWPIWFIQCPLGVLHRVHVLYVDGGKNMCSIIRRRGLWAKMDNKTWAFENGNRQPGGPADKPDLFWSLLLKSCYSIQCLKLPPTFFGGEISQFLR